jgi:peptidoglycan/LPS O-acetylase OafA/YrhL
MWMETWLIPGYLGVDLFFILSGFIISLVHIDMSPDMRELGSFYVKRIFRVYPLDVCVMLFLAANAWRLNQIGNGWYDRQTFLPVLLMIQPYFMHPPINGWLATNWSVGIELSCYLAFPALLILLRRRGRIVGLTSLAVFLALEGLCQFYYRQRFFGPGAIFRGLAGFGLGASAAFAARAWPRFSARTTTIIGLTCIAAILGLLMEQIQWPIPLCMAGLIASLSYRSGPIVRFCEMRIVVWLGEISYSIYLVHSIFLGGWGWWWVAEIRAHMPGRVAPAAWIAVCLGVTTIISALTYYAIERPCRRLGGMIAKRISGRKYVLF